MDNLIYLSIIILAGVGFGISLHIHLEKKKQKPMVCPLKTKCEEVLFSQYADFLGVPNDILGMLYYAFVFFGFSSILFYPTTINTPLPFVLSTAIISGFMFSIYLVFVQSIKIKEWCSWCLMSATTSTLIFIFLSQTQYLSTHLSNIALEYSYIIIPIYACFLAIGLGISILSEILFVRFLKDRVISETESRVLHTCHQIIWAILIFVILSNYVLSMSNTFFLQPRFVSKTVILTILVILTFFYESLVSTKLLEIYRQPNMSKSKSLESLRALPFVLGPISLISWYSIFIIDSGIAPTSSTLQILSTYLIMIIIGVIFGNFLKQKLTSGWSAGSKN